MGQVELTLTVFPLYSVNGRGKFIDSRSVYPVDVTAVLSLVPGSGDVLGTYFI